MQCVANGRGFTQFSSRVTLAINLHRSYANDFINTENQKVDPFLRPETPSTDLKHVPIERDPEVRSPLSHKLKIEMRDYEPQDIRIELRGCQVSL